MDESKPEEKQVDEFAQRSAVVAKEIDALLARHGMKMVVDNRIRLAPVEPKKD